jgi:DNA-binding MarR family transcriptional regulator
MSTSEGSENLNRRTNRKPGATARKKGDGHAAGASRPAGTARAKRSAAPLTVSRKELLVEGSDGEFRKLVHGLFTFFALHTAIRDGYAAALGLPGPQYTILLCIRNLSDTGPVNIRTVAEYLRLSASFVTAETNTLEQMGLVSKDRGEHDRRTVLLKITPRGASLLDSIAELRRRINDVEFGCLTAEEFRALVPLIARLVQSGERAHALQRYLRDHAPGATEATVPLDILPS